MASVITIKRRQNLCAVTSGAVQAIPPITHIAFGSGGVDGGGEPLGVSGDMEALRSETARYPLDPVDPDEDKSGISYPGNGATTARYRVTIPEADLAGEDINEAALVDGAGELAAIKTMYSKRKDGDVKFTFTFDDEF